MSDEYEARKPAGRRRSWLPDCPVCGQPVTQVTVTSPFSGTASPCGCTVAPNGIERE